MKKKFTRAAPDQSQSLRRAFQIGFLALNVWIGAQFYLFVRHYESGGMTPRVERPPGVEGWLPIASMMNLRLWIETSQLPRVHPAGLFLLISFLAISLLLRKAFCSWLCPVGTFSEYLWRSGRGVFRRNWRLPKSLDLVLRSLKYALLGFFVYAVMSMTAGELRAFLEGPYGVVADVKMLNFFRYLTVSGAVVLGVLVVSSLFVQNVWCRFLCPYGALLGIFARLSPLRIRREEARCIDCARCAKVCPALLPVDRLATVGSVECTGCLECVAACPAEGALRMAAPGRRKVPAWAFAAAVAVIFLGICGVAMWTGHWQTELPALVYRELVPHAREFAHP